LLSAVFFPSFSAPKRRSSAQQGAGQAGGAAAAVDAEFGGGEGAEVETGLAEAGICFFIFFNYQEAIVA
jgi:hypothetical protein